MKIHSLSGRPPLLEDKRAQLAGLFLGLVSVYAAAISDWHWPIALVVGLGSAAAGVTLGRVYGGWQHREQQRSADVKASRSAGLGAEIRDIVSVLDVPAFVITPTSKILCCNARARTLFPDIREGQPLYQVSRHPGLLEAVQRAREQISAQTGEMLERAQGGRRLLASITPLKTQGAGDVAEKFVPADIFLLAQFRDLSQQDRLAQLRSDFIANASHELRTPLSSVKGFIETLQGPASEDAAARMRFLAIMAAQASRMARILDDLLSLSRIEMRAHLAPTDEVDIGRIVLDAVEGLEPIARDAKITLTFDESSETYLARGDRDELEQVFQNLIHNAIKYGREGGKVDVVIKREPPAKGGSGRIAVDIADDGPGIGEEHLPRLTERFYRVDTATSREKGGTGLGLAIVKHILNRHHGELDIRSVLGKGSTFSVILNALPE
jgi:two-component system, OmpR family, phosphate regulon sensor histidine kinase PhoR